MSELSEIDKIRWQRDTAVAERDRLKAEIERLTTLLSYAEAALRSEVALRLGTGRESNTEGDL